MQSYYSIKGKLFRYARIPGIMDIVDTATRSRMMSGIRAKDTKPEMLIRRFLHSQGFRYRLHDSRLAGKPDIVLPKYRVAIFVHGCFWHQHPGCKYATTPGSNQQKWAAKFRANEERDRRSMLVLRETGWNVIVIWECGLRSKDAIRALDWLPKAIKQPPASVLEWPKKA
jgi:DNA mismatch endonuclease (patch repair protein)